jgi:alanine dehydrogenase
MKTNGTLLVDRSSVREFLGLRECIDMVEMVFRRQGEGKIPLSGILGVRAQNGALHVKAAGLTGAKNYIAVKLNTNFPQNYVRFGLPTIQGLIVLYDADDGRLLAVLDSTEITIKRTAAATAVAAKYLARKNSSVAGICGCGEQGRAHLRAFSLMFPLRKVYAFDIDPHASERLVAQFSGESRADIEFVGSPSRAIPHCDIVIACTPSTEFYVHKKDVSPGTFIAAIGADDSHKQEIDPALLCSVKVVADSLQQVCSIGDTHHAITSSSMRKEDIYGELSEVVAGRKPGRTNDDEIIIFDSTGIAIEDAAAATLVYEKACETKNPSKFEFAA